MSPRNKQRSSERRVSTQRLMQLAQWGIPLIASMLVSYGTAQYRAGSAEAATTLKITTISSRLDELAGDVVPRKETELQWKALAESQATIQADVREVRATQKEILLRLPSSK